MNSHFFDIETLIAEFEKKPKVRRKQDEGRTIRQGID